MKKIYLIIVFLIGVNAIVFPNAQQELLLALMVLGAALSLINNWKCSHRYVLLFIASCSVTIFYSLVGILRDAPVQAIVQTLFVYIASPLAWLLIIDLAWRKFGLTKIVDGLAVLAILASASVPIYFYLYLNYGPHAVEFFGSRANVHLEEGYSGVIMHVLGSLIFLGAAFSAEPGSTSRKGLGYFVFFSLTLATFSSGRTVAILALVIGSAFFLLTSTLNLKNKLFLRIGVITASIAVSIFALDYLIDINTIELLGRHYDKLAGGDVERPAQISALIEGSLNTYFLGAGHGLGVDYLRSLEFPWRYESVFFALLYKVGVFGLLILLAPILLALNIFFKILINKKIERYDCFFGAALLASVLASFTNPYLEAFSFQWMYLLPVYYFLAGRQFKAHDFKG